MRLIWQTATIQHANGGPTVAPMNQTQNGGQWNLLGTFTLNPALNPKLELSDQANGRVVADAIMVVPSGVSTDHVTYTPTLTTTDTLDIYAKWGENANRSEAVTYTVQHAGGASDIVVNQQQPSAGWFRLGAFVMNPGQNHGVEVRGALEGVTVADAVRFVSAGTSAPGIQYVHTDHLGSPQKMTDASKAIVWDAVYTPFGQVHSITGTATNNQRFPGQYFDQETGYHYNYFRDYDPTTGRYIESDPIGLRGGLNLYSYVGNNALRYIDPLGLYPGEEYVDYIGNFKSGTGDFIRNYKDMRQANFIGADKYFHCKANCESAQKGEGGEAAAKCISDFREWVDQNIKGGPPSESAADQVANGYGRSQGSSNPTGDCRQLCSTFRPGGLPFLY